MIIYPNSRVNSKASCGKIGKLLKCSRPASSRILGLAQPTIVKFPSGNISFLHGINPIGTKFRAATALGPQSSEYFFRPHHFHGEKLRLNIVFDFGYYIKADDELEEERF